MIKYISPIYSNSKIEQAIYEAIGREFDSAEVYSGEVLLQLNPQTATWGVALWEKKLGLPTNSNESYDIRRKKVLAKLQSKYIINPERMAMILKNYTGADIEITENIEPYTFEVKLIGREGFPRSLEDLYKEVKRIKPSHLSVKYKLISITQSKLYVGTCLLTGEEITVYPWRTKSIEAKGKIHVTLANNISVENITVYPREEE